MKKLVLMVSGVWCWCICTFYLAMWTIFFASTTVVSSSLLIYLLINRTAYEKVQAFLRWGAQFPIVFQAGSRKNTAVFFPPPPPTASATTNAVFAPEEEQGQEFVSQVPLRHDLGVEDKGIDHDQQQQRPYTRSGEWRSRERRERATTTTAPLGYYHHQGGYVDSEVGGGGLGGGLNGGGGGGGRQLTHRTIEETEENQVEERMPTRKDQVRYRAVPVPAPAPAEATTTMTKRTKKTRVGVKTVRLSDILKSCHTGKAEEAEETTSRGGGRGGKSGGVQKTRRKRTTDKERVELILRQDGRCAHCRHRLRHSSLFEIDHIVPLYIGGPNELDNRQALCRNCHGVKTHADRLKYASSSPSFSSSSSSLIAQPTFVTAYHAAAAPSPAPAPSSPRSALIW